MPPVWEQLTDAAWKVTVFPLPPGHYGAGAVGMAAGRVAGNAETAGARSHGFLWDEATQVKILVDRKRDVRLCHARGEVIVGEAKPKRGAGEGFLGRVAADGIVVARIAHPSGYEESCIRATDGVRHVGTARRDGIQHPIVWDARGEATQLSAPGDEGAAAVAVAGGTAVGFAGWPSQALLWNLESGDLASLHPPRNTWSQALGTDGETHVGWIAATDAGWAAGNWVPVTWNGSGESPTRLLPVGFVAGSARDIWGGVQVGEVREASEDGRAGAQKAALWGGTADRFVDLHALVGAPWTDSQALSIHHTVEELSIVGEVRLMAPDRRGIADRRIVRWCTRAATA